MNLTEKANSFRVELIHLSDNGLLSFEDCFRIQGEIRATIDQFKELPKNSTHDEVILILLTCEIEIEMCLSYLLKSKKIKGSA